MSWRAKSALTVSMLKVTPRRRPVGQAGSEGRCWVISQRDWSEAVRRCQLESWLVLPTGWGGIIATREAAMLGPSRAPGWGPMVVSHQAVLLSDLMLHQYVPSLSLCMPIFLFSTSIWITSWCDNCVVQFIITAVKIDGGEHICINLLHLLPSFFTLFTYCFTLGECFINQAGGLCWWGGEKPSFRTSAGLGRETESGCEYGCWFCRSRVGVCWDIEDKEGIRNRPSGTTARSER